MPDNGRSWTEKYRPQSLDEILGNPSAVRQLKQWAESWTDGPPDKPGLILVGEPGIGKTSAALALAREMGWSAIELNASDARNKDAIERVVTRGAVSQGFSETGEFQRTSDKLRKLIILDEADNVFGREDRGGMQQIVETLKQTQQPMVLIANDGYALSRRSSSLKRLCEEITFKKVQASTIAKILGRISQAEGIEADIPALERLAEHAGGDVRAAVSDLESLARATGQLTLEDVDALGYRDKTASIFDALRDVLKATDFKTAKEATYDLDEDPETLLLWVEENAPREYTNAHDRARAMTAVGRADEFLGATRRTRYYRLWSVASDMMTGGVAVAKDERYSGWTRYQFPSWLRKMSRSKKARGLRESLGLKVGEAFHAGTRTANEHVIPMLAFVAKRSKPFAVELTAELELEADELALLLDTKASTKKVKTILEEAEELRERRGTAEEGHHEHERLEAPVWEQEGYEPSAPAPKPEAGSSQETDEAASVPNDEGEDEAASAEEDEEDTEDDESQKSLFEF